MRSIVISAAVNALIAAMPRFSILSAQDKMRVEQEMFDLHRKGAGKKPLKRHSDAMLDPYYGLKTRGRRGAAGRLKLQQQAFAGTERARRNPRRSNPFTLPHRVQAFNYAMKQLAPIIPNYEQRFKAAQASARRVGA